MTELTGHSKGELVAWTSAGSGQEKRSQGDSARAPAVLPTVSHVYCPFPWQGTLDESCVWVSSLQRL